MIGATKDLGPLTPHVMDSLLDDGRRLPADAFGAVYRIRAERAVERSLAPYVARAKAQRKRDRLHNPPVHPTKGYRGSHKKFRKGKRK